MICIWITVTGCSPLTVVWTASPHFDKQSTIDQIQEKVDQTYTLLTHSAMCQKNYKTTCLYNLTNGHTRNLGRNKPFQCEDIKKS